MGWSDYGFPNITMLPNITPALAISNANEERSRLSVNDWYGAMSSGWTPAIMKGDASFRYSSRYAQYTQYTYSINHFLDWTVHPEEALWNQNTLSQAVFDRYPGNRLYIPTQDNIPEHLRSLYMTTDWHKDSAIQLYMYINLQKIIATHYKVTMGYGYAESTSSDAAWDAACANFSFSEVERFPGLAGTWSLWRFDTRFRRVFRGVGGPEVACTIRQPMKIEPDYDTYPELIGLPAYIYAKAYSPTDGGYYGFDFVNVPGWSKAFSLPYHSTVPIRPIATLPTNEELSYNFDTGYAVEFYDTGPLDRRSTYCGVDCSSIFEFYDNVD